MATIACIVLFLVLVGGAWPLADSWRRSRSGEIYEGLAPGMTPPAGREQPTRHLTQAELEATTYAVQFHPPEGVEPRDVGLLLDRVTGPRDLAATIISLVVHGYLQLRKDDEQDDWLVTVDRDPRRPAWAREEPDSLWLLEYFDIGGGEPVPLSRIKPGLRQAFSQLESQVVADAYARGWIKVDPRGRRAPTGVLALGAALCLAFAGILALAGSPLAWVAAGGAGALAITATRVRGHIGRPAEGTAAYFRTLGFKRYLETAEAHQIKVEDAAGIFSRYLPWAIAFDVADRWTGVFKEVAAGIDDDIAALWAPDLLWMAVWMDLASGGALFGGLGDALGDLTGSIGDFTTDLFDGGLFDGGMFDGAGDGGGLGEAFGDFFGGGDGGGGFDGFDF